MRQTPRIEEATSRGPTPGAASRYVQKSRLLGLVNRKERWSLSWRGRLILACALIMAGVLVLKGIYPFLALTHRVDADVLVVEGWVREYAIRAALDEFRSHSYVRVFATGGPVEGNGGYINDYYTSASVGADLLKKDGLSDESVQMVPSRVMDRDRTYGSAVALRNWFREHNMSVHSINVVTEDLHARRTRLLFQKALGHDVAVGVIAVPNPDYDSTHWWRYSEGVREVIGEGIAYMYAKFLFWPSNKRPQDNGTTGQQDDRTTGQQDNRTTGRRDNTTIGQLRRERLHENKSVAAG